MSEVTIGLTEDERNALLPAVEAWAQRHPCPDEPVIIAGTNLYNPIEIADALRDQASPILERMLRRAIDSDSLEVVVLSFRQGT